jgi:hypothetical protein
MKETTAVILALIMLFAAGSANAGEFATLKQKLVDSRYALWIMLDNVDKRGEDQQKKVKDTADAVSAMLAVMKAPAGKEAQFKELASVWKAFKKTREEELIPLILARKKKEADEVAKGIQYERFMKMMALIAELEK